MRPYSRLSTVHKGTAFERRALGLLKDDLSMNLYRVGGKADGGVDLAGWWWLPPPLLDDPRRRRLRVLAQCKAEKRKFGPNYVREMEGVFWHARNAANVVVDAAAAASVVALLVSESPFTRATLLRARSSHVPFLLLHLPPDMSGIGTAYPNPVLARLTAPLEILWERTAGSSGRPGLWLDGRRVAGDRNVLKDMYNH